MICAGDDVAGGHIEAEYFMGLLLIAQNENLGVIEAERTGTSREVDLLASEEKKLDDLDLLGLKGAATCRKAQCR